MDNSCIIAQFHLDKPSVSAWFHFRARFGVAYHRNLERRSTLANVALLLKVSSCGSLSWWKTGGTAVIQGLRLQRLSQTWQCSRSLFLSFSSIYNLSREDERMRRAITSACTALRAQTLGGHVTPSITMDAGFRCCWLQGFPSWVSQARRATWAHLPSHLAPDIGKLNRKNLRLLPLSGLPGSFSFWMKVWEERISF